MAGRNRLKTEHTGAKNGGGYYGPREFAKYYSRKLRRARNQAAINEQCFPDTIHCWEEEIPLVQGGGW